MQGEWVNELRQAASLPLGVVDDPRKLTINTPLEDLIHLRVAAWMLAADALAMQAKGKHSEALDNLLTVLALGNNLCNKSVSISYQVCLEMQGVALHGLERWREQVKSEPALLRRALDALTKHEAELPPLADAVKADYLVLQNTAEQPTGLVVHLGDSAYLNWQATSRMKALERARLFPWEQERWRRQLYLLLGYQLIGAQSQGAPEHNTPVVSVIRKRWSGSWLDAWAMLRFEHGLEVAVTEDRFLRLLYGPERQGQPFAHVVKTKDAAQQILARIRGERLRLASQLYEAETGKAPQSAADLVPKYLPAVPLDPIGGVPLPLPGPAGAAPREG